MDIDGVLLPIDRHLDHGKFPSSSRIPYQTARAPRGALSVPTPLLSEPSTAIHSIARARGSAIVTLRSPLTLSTPLFKLESIRRARELPVKHDPSFRLRAASSFRARAVITQFNTFCYKGRVPPAYG